MRSGNTFIIFMEYFIGQELTNYIRYNKTQITAYDFKDIMVNIVQGVAHIHSKNMVHGDLKPANILYNDEDIKIADFGLSCIREKYIADCQSCRTCKRVAIGTRLYMAPELFYTNYIYKASATDIWALGIIMYQLTESRIPFSYTTVDDLKIKILQTKPTYTYPNKAITDIIKSCLHRAPQDRPSAQELLQELQALAV